MLKQVYRVAGVAVPRGQAFASFSTAATIAEEEGPVIIGDVYSPLSISTKTATQIRPRDMDEALRLARAFSTASYDESIQLNLNLGIDPRKPGQTVRGVARVPHASGRKAIVAVFAKGEKVSRDILEVLLSQQSIQYYIPFCFTYLAYTLSLVLSYLNILCSSSSFPSCTTLYRLLKLVRLAQTLSATKILLLIFKVAKLNSLVALPHLI